MQIDTETLDSLLACPVCKGPLRRTEHSCKCLHPECDKSFPIMHGVPVLLYDDRSVFKTSDFTAGVKQAHEGTSRPRRILERIVPSITHNWVAKENYTRLASLLGKDQRRTVLVVGAGELGEGFATWLDEPNIVLAETDVYFAPRVSAIADCHDLPFRNGGFDAVVIQAVLEHVTDPVRCVAEIHRVLKDDGYVYAETPFLFPVHMGPYDFTRFTRGGHRRLFRNFTEVDSDMASGPATALTLSIRSFFLGMSRARWMSTFAQLVLPFLVFWIKYFDYWLIRNPHAADYAASFYFIGRKSTTPIPDGEIIAQHWSCSRRG